MRRLPYLPAVFLAFLFQRLVRYAAVAQLPVRGAVLSTTRFFARVLLPGRAIADLLWLRLVERALDRESSVRT